VAPRKHPTIAISAISNHQEKFIGDITEFLQQEESFNLDEF